VVEPVEQVTWNGRFNVCGALLVTRDAVYLGGNYMNSYKNGSRRRDPKANVFVARYDLEGNQVWFRQARHPKGSGSGVPFFMGLTPEGDLVTLTHSGETFVVRTKDGAPLPQFQAGASKPSAAAPPSAAQPAPAAPPKADAKETKSEKPVKEEARTESKAKEKRKK
jgi:hypothetical protein